MLTKDPMMKAGTILLVGVAWLAACSTPSTSSTAGVPQGTVADWSCETSPRVKIQLATMPRDILTVRATLAFTGRPLEGLDVRTCAETPCRAATAEATTDEAGVARLTWGESVAIDGTELGAFPTFGAFPTNVFYVAPGARTLEAEVYNEVSILESVQAVGVSRVDGSGTLFVRISDCGGALAAGVTLAVEGADERTITRYAERNQPIATGRDATDASGAGTVFNVPPGLFHLVAHDVRTGRTVASYEGYVPSNGIAHTELTPGF